MNEAFVIAAGPIAAELLRQWSAANPGQQANDDVIASCFETARRAVVDGQQRAMKAGVFTDAR